MFALRGARQAQAVLLRSRVRALVRTHPARPVALDPHAAEEAAARATLPVRSGVVLRVRPDRRLLVADERALGLPGLELLARGLVWIGLTLGQVYGDDVERRALDQRGALVASITS